MSIVFVGGARPNWMKLAPILRAFGAGAMKHRARLVHTGQHYDPALSSLLFEQLGLPEPDVHLNVGSDRHGAQTGRIMGAFEEYVIALAEPPRGIVVVGDVNSTMACTLVGAKLGVPVAHVEAGLRSFDRTMPEEINRLVTDAIADLLLVSEPAGMTNLAAEGVRPERIHYVGNVMIDSLVAQLPTASALSMPARVGVEPGSYALVTLHRPSNVDAADRLAALTDFLARVAAVMPVVFPVHPRTDKKLAELGHRARLESANVRLLPPQGYLEFVGLMERARVVISDSGGIQEETTYLGVPCVTMRGNTERPVTIERGTNTLVGDDLELAWRLVEDIRAGRYKTGTTIDGWDGRAAERVVATLAAAW